MTPSPFDATVRTTPPPRARLLLIALIGLLALSSGVGAQPLTPDEAVRRALDRPEVTAVLDADLADAEADVGEAALWANPELSLEREAGEPALGDPDETTILLSQTFPLGARRGLQRQAARLGVDAARASILARYAELRAALLRDYYSVVTAGRQRGQLAAWIAQLQRIERIAAARAQAGDLAGFEQRRIAQQLQRARLRLAAADSELALARSELASRIGIAVDDLRLPDDIDVLPPSPVDARAGRSHALDALDARRAQVEAERAAARGWHLPVSVGVGRKRFDGAGQRDDALLFEVSLPLPLFDRNQVERQRAEADWQRADAAYRLARERELARRGAAAQQLRQRLETAQRWRADLLPQARELARIAEASFAEGELDLVGLLGALDEARDAGEQTLDAELQARHAAIEFERMHPTPATGD